MAARTKWCWLVALVPYWCPAQKCPRILPVPSQESWAHLIKADEWPTVNTVLLLCILGSSVLPLIKHMGNCLRPHVNPLSSPNKVSGQLRMVFNHLLHIVSQDRRPTEYFLRDHRIPPPRGLFLLEQLLCDKLFYWFCLHTVFLKTKQ